MALREAEKAFDADEVPIGCVIVHENKIIGRSYNQRELLGDATAHAEMIAISAACEANGDWRLENCTLYVTMEPCPMCAGAIVLSRIPRLVYAVDDPRAGACGTLYDIVSDDRLNHRAEKIRGILENESRALVQDFFQKLRRKKGETI